MINEFLYACLFAFVVEVLYDSLPGVEIFSTVIARCGGCVVLCNCVDSVFCPHVCVALLFGSEGFVACGAFVDV